jgi:hypothetical protein
LSDVLTLEAGSVVSCDSRLLVQLEFFVLLAQRVPVDAGDLADYHAQHNRGLNLTYDLSPAREGQGLTRVRVGDL